MHHAAHHHRTVHHPTTHHADVVFHHRRLQRGHATLHEISHFRRVRPQCGDGFSIVGCLHHGDPVGSRLVADADLIFVAEDRMQRLAPVSYTHLTLPTEEDSVDLGGRRI